jgi:hypothetical protein
VDEILLAPPKCDQVCNGEELRYFPRTKFEMNKVELNITMLDLALTTYIVLVISNLVP